MLQHQFRSPPDPSAMPVALSLNAISFLNQIPRAEAQRIERALERLSTNYELLSRSHVRRLAGPEDASGHSLSSYRVAHDVRAFIYVEQGVIHVVEIIRKGQLESLKSLPRVDVRKGSSISTSTERS